VGVPKAIDIAFCVSLFNVRSIHAALFITNLDLLSADPRNLPINSTGPWSDYDRYVRTHFQLLKEDYVTSLREDLREYLHHYPAGRLGFVVYELKLEGPTPKMALTYTAAFTTLNRNHTRSLFAFGSRLKYGSLVALILCEEGGTSDQRHRVQELVFGSIASCREEDVVKGVTALAFTPDEAKKLRFDVTYIAIER